MGKLLYLGLFIASLDPTYNTASETSRRALLETQMMKEELKHLENESEAQLYKFTGLKKEDLVYAAYAYPLFAGKVSSKPFKNFKYVTEDGLIIRPEIEYGIYNKEATVYLGFVKDF